MPVKSISAADEEIGWTVLADPARFVGDVVAAEVGERQRVQVLDEALQRIRQTLRTGPDRPHDH